MRNILLVFVTSIIAVVAIYFLGPRASDRASVSFKPSEIGEDLDTYLAQKESRVPDIREGLQKEIVWADPQTKEKTAYSIVYIHGFSASKEEIRPIPDRVADRLQANLYYTRLQGHGRTGDAMAEGTLSGWLNDVAEALTIGRRIGDKTIVIATSTGATLAAWGSLTHSDMMAGTHALVLFSPNFGPNAVGSFLLAAPFAEHFVPWLLGPTYGTNAGASAKEDHAWTLSYASKALIPMAAAVDAVNRLDPSTNTIPTLFIYAMKDKTVDAAKTETVYEAWAEPKSRILIEASGDPNFHVNAGDIISPENNDSVTNDILEWLKSLGMS